MAVAKVVRKLGDRFGCTDTAPPESTNDYELSRILDMLDAAPDPQAKQRYFQELLYDIKVDFNYSKWSYVPPDPWDPRHNASVKFMTVPPTP